MISEKNASSLVAYRINNVISLLEVAEKELAQIPLNSSTCKYLNEILPRLDSVMRSARKCYQDEIEEEA